VATTATSLTWYTAKSWASFSVTLALVGGASIEHVYLLLFVLFCFSVSVTLALVGGASIERVYNFLPFASLYQ
jgi:hypothetical protein